MRRSTLLLACLVLVTAYCLLDQFLYAAPALPPTCDKWCAERYGPFIGDGQCFFYSASTCESCNGESDAYSCVTDEATTNRACVAELGTVADDPTIWVLKRYYKTNPAPCNKSCAVTTPGYQAIVSGSPDINADLDTETTLMLCGLPVNDPSPVG